MKLSKSQKEFFANMGWSAHKFLPHAYHLAANFIGEIGVGRTVVYLHHNNTLIKVYVHHNGRSDDYLTLTDSKGHELQTLHCSEPKEKLLEAVLALIRVSNAANL